MRYLLCAALLALFTVNTAAADDKKILCPISGHEVDKSFSVTHNGGKVYVCCEECVKGFNADPAKYAAKANLQLVQTGQAKEIKCPLSGQPLNPATKIQVGGVDVAFCCNNCKGKAAAAKGDDQIKLVFNDEAFKKGYEVTPAK